LIILCSILKCHHWRTKKSFLFSTKCYEDRHPNTHWFVLLEANCDSWWLSFASPLITHFQDFAR
jgi:hypothetical protein